MADFLDDMDRRENDSQKIKSNEITGKRYPFHSLPKELQDMGNVYYVQEKEAQGTVDKNIISKSNLNGYMWMCIKDGTKYGMLMTLVALSFIIKWKLAPNLIGFLVGMLFFAPITVYIAYHLVYYAIIRAQVIGPVTKAIANFTTYTYYMTFFGVFISTMIMFLFTIMMIKEILLLIFTLITHVYVTLEPGGYGQKALDCLIWLHNKLVEIAYSDGTLFNNIYTLSFLTIGGSIAFFYFFENSNYKIHRVDIEREYEATKINLGYPIEGSQKMIKIWRDSVGKDIFKASQGEPTSTELELKKRPTYNEASFDKMMKSITEVG